MFHDDEIIQGRFTRNIIRRKARWLVGRAGLMERDREDLEQELFLRLIRSLRLFNPARAHRNVFVTTVVNRQVAMILRDRLAKKCNGGAVGSLDQEWAADGNAADPIDPRPSAQESCDLADDLAEVLARLPDDLRSLADRLKSRSISEAARDLKSPRSTVQRQVHRLRQRFEDAGLRIYL